MACEEAENGGMRIKLLQESIWSNGDKLNRLLEHAIATEGELVSLRRWLEHFVKRMSDMFESNDGSIQKEPDDGVV